MGIHLQRYVDVITYILLLTSASGKIGYYGMTLNYLWSKTRDLIW